MLLERIQKLNKARLVGLHPVLIAKATTLLAAMDAAGYPMLVTGGLRTVVQQKALYALGRTKAGKIVTYKDGVKSVSNHQPKADGFGRALDATFLVDLDHDGEVDDPTWDDKRPWELYGTKAEELGLTWGGRWKMQDKPHIEMV